MKRKPKKREVGRPYSPWDRITLAERYAELKFEFLKAGDVKPGAAAEHALFEECHRTHSLGTLKKLRVQGRAEAILLDEGRLDEAEADIRRRGELLGQRRRLKRHQQR